MPNRRGERGRSCPPIVASQVLRTTATTRSRSTRSAAAVLDELVLDHRRVLVVESAVVTEDVYAATYSWPPSHLRRPTTDTDGGLRLSPPAVQRRRASSTDSRRVEATSNMPYMYVANLYSSAPLWGGRAAQRGIARRECARAVQCRDPVGVHRRDAHVVRPRVGETHLGALARLDGHQGIAQQAQARAAEPGPLPRRACRRGRASSVRGRCVPLRAGFRNGCRCRRHRCCSRRRHHCTCGPSRVFRPASANRSRMPNGLTFRPCSAYVSSGPSEPKKAQNR